MSTISGHFSHSLVLSYFATSDGKGGEGKEAENRGLILETCFRNTSIDSPDRCDR